MAAVAESATAFARANADLHAGRWDDAIRAYVEALPQAGRLAPRIAFNHALARRRLQQQRWADPRRRVAVCGWDLSHNAAGRVHALASLYRRCGEVDMIGCLFRARGLQLWEPLRNAPLPVHALQVMDLRTMAEDALRFVLAHPYDLVHLSKPRAPNLLLGILYQLVWGAKVLMDVDDEECAFVGAEAPMAVAPWLHEHATLPPASALLGREWTVLAAGSADLFDGVTVSNTQLQQRYGGTVIPHVRDEQAYTPSPTLRAINRRRWQIAPDDKVVLFFGTPREHKGVLAIAEAVGALRRDDVLFVVAGDFPDPALKERVRQAAPRTLLLGNQPFASGPSVLSVADACVLLQDPTTLVARFQSPAKLVDAYAMGIPVLAAVTPTLAADAAQQLLIPVTPHDLAQQLDLLLGDPTAAQAMAARAHAHFLRTLSVSANEATARAFCQAPPQLRRLPPALAAVLAHLATATGLPGLLDTDNAPPMPRPE